MFGVVAARVVAVLTAERRHHDGVHSSLTATQGTCLHMGRSLLGGLPASRTLAPCGRSLGGAYARAARFGRLAQDLRPWRACRRCVTLGSVLVYDFVPVRVPFDRATATLRALPAATLASAGVIAFGGTNDGRLERGPLRNRWDAVVFDVKIAGDPEAAGFEYFEGEVQFAPLVGAGSHLSLSASYERTTGHGLSPQERVRSHRETELRVRELLVLVATQLEMAPAER